MARFQDEEELYAVLGGFFEEVAEMDVAKDMLEAVDIGEGYDTFVQYVFHHPEGKITWADEDGKMKVICGDTDLRPELVFEQTADVANRFWLGRLDLQQALARQQITASGPLAKALKVLPMMEEIYPAYRTYLEKLGRDDLLK